MLAAGTPQAIPVARHRPAVRPIASRIGLVHVLCIGHGPSRLRNRFTPRQRNQPPGPGMGRVRQTPRSIMMVLNVWKFAGMWRIGGFLTCLLYTSDAADDLLCVDLG